MLCESFSQKFGNRKNVRRKSLRKEKGCDRKEKLCECWSSQQSYHNVQTKYSLEPVWCLDITKYFQLIPQSNGIELCYFFIWIEMWKLKNHKMSVNIGFDCVFILKWVHLCQCLDIFLFRIRWKIVIKIIAFWFRAEKPTFNWKKIRIEFQRWKDSFWRQEEKSFAFVHQFCELKSLLIIII